MLPHVMLVSFCMPKPVFELPEEDDLFVDTIPVLFRLGLSKTLGHLRGAYQ